MQGGSSRPGHDPLLLLRFLLLRKTKTCSSWGASFIVPSVQPVTAGRILEPKSRRALGMLGRAPLGAAAGKMSRCSVPIETPPRRAENWTGKTSETDFQRLGPSARHTEQAVCSAEGWGVDCSSAQRGGDAVQRGRRHNRPATNSGGHFCRQPKASSRHQAASRTRAD